MNLQPAALAVLLQRAGRDPNEAVAVVRDSADDFAGLWVAHHAASRFPPDHDLPKDAVSALSNGTRRQLSVDWAGRRTASLAALDPTVAQVWEDLLEAAWTEYTSDRAEPDWYRRCLGKQTLGRTAAALEFKSGDALERQIVALWNSGEVAPPPDLIELRTYVGGIGA